MKGPFDDLYRQYPGYIILVKIGNLYEAFGNDADVVHTYLGYQVRDTGMGHICAGSDFDVIRTELQKHGFSVLLVDRGKLSVYATGQQVPTSFGQQKSVSNPPSGVVKQPTKPQTPFASLKAKHPNHVVIVKAGCFYEAYDNDAKIVNALLGYKLLKAGAWYKCGGPNFNAINNELRKNGFGVILIDGSRKKIYAPTYVPKKPQLTSNIVTLQEKNGVYYVYDDEADVVAVVMGPGTRPFMDKGRKCLVFIDETKVRTALLNAGYNVNIYANGIVTRYKAEDK